MTSAPIDAFATATEMLAADRRIEFAAFDPTAASATRCLSVALYSPWRFASGALATERPARDSRTPP